MEPGIPKSREKPMNGFLVRRSLQAAEGIPEDLAHHALLAYGTLRKNSPQPARVGERGVRNSSNLTLGVEVKIDLLLVLAIACGTLDQDGLVLPQAADRVKTLEPEANRVHQPVA